MTAKRQLMLDAAALVVTAMMVLIISATGLLGLYSSTATALTIVVLSIVEVWLWRSNGDWDAGDWMIALLVDLVASAIFVSMDCNGKVGQIRLGECGGGMSALFTLVAVGGLIPLAVGTLRALLKRFI